MIPTTFTPRPRIACLALLWALWIGLAGNSSTSRAGGGPENVLLVVNSSSWASMTVANHYIHWRQIPANNVLYLPWPNAGIAISVDDFRKFLLRAVLGVIQARGLSNQIDYVVYSSDFPTTIEVTSLLRGQQPPEHFVPMASLTGMTYYWPMVQANNPTCLGVSANRYMRYDEVTDPLVAKSRAFRSWYGWGENGELREAGGEHYMLSTMLAVTGGRGNSVREALRYLQRATAADGSRPEGTIYYANTVDERTRRRDRDSSFGAAAADLRKLGVAAEVIADLLPRGKRDVMGLTVGTPLIPWAKTRSTILPGAICDNFNYLGGVFDTNAEYAVESPLSEFLRYGAAGACGTVVEPHGFPQKFPTAQMHVHYARGCSLGEAVYQSVAGPYQLLVVGDPLCRPWAKIPRIEVTGVQAGAKVKGTITMEPSAVAAGMPVDRFRLFVEGNLADSVNTGDAFQLDTTRLTDGHIELRVVGIENSAIETQGSVAIPLEVDNHGHSMQFSAAPPENVRWGEQVTLRAAAPGAVVIGFYHGNLQPTNLLGTVDGDSGELQINVEAEKFGYGPMRLLAVAYDSADKSQRRVVATPITLTIHPSSLLPGRTLRGGTKLAPGMTLINALNRRVNITDTRQRKWLENAGVLPRQQYSLTAVFQVPSDDIYQFQVQHLGDVRIDVDGRNIYDGAQDRPLQNLVPVVLGKGLHRMVIEGRAGSLPLLDLRFGSSRVDHVDGAMFQHPQ